jgi:NAD(P)-dependent dehydrogenase (short-subunit alcohol dehydrogenase family)
MTGRPLEGRGALVTGASRGIGAATAVALDRAGARVALVARTRDALNGVAARLEHEHLMLVTDLAVPEAPPRVAQDVLAAWERVDILVNNAAAAARVPAVDTDARLIDGLLAVNVRAPLLLIAALVPSMIAHGGGSIINLSSVSGLVGTPRRAAYAASKGALEAASRSLAAELGPSGIRVNCVAPGVVDTALWARNKQVPGVVEAVEALTPLRRWAAAEDVAEVIVFLASDAARFVTGETISADGGMAHSLDLYAGPV